MQVIVKEQGEKYWKYYFFRHLTAGIRLLFIIKNKTDPKSLTGYFSYMFMKTCDNMFW